MKLIEKLEYTQHLLSPGVNEKKFIGKVEIKEELIRPIIEFVNTKNKRINIGNMKLYTSLCDKEEIDVVYENNHYSHLNFDEKEVAFLCKMYSLDAVIREGELCVTPPKEYYQKVGDENIDEEPHVRFQYIIDEDKEEYLIISFDRYPLGYPDRGKDQLSPFVTYIHGIWESPLLTDEIINKIKES